MNSITKLIFAVSTVALFTQSSPGVAQTAPACDYSNAHLHDGWGWDPVTRQSCAPQTDTVLQPPVTTPSNNGVATCQLASDPDGDGWGWENNSTCQVRTTTQPSVIQTNCDDSDGDGWGWDGTASCRVNEVTATPPITSSSSTSEPSPIAPIPSGFNAEGGSVLGNWYCASVDYDTGRFRTDWETFWQLEFNNDQTIILGDGSDSVSTWWYTADGVNIQWSHRNGTTANYVLNVGNRGGMEDEGSRCVRELPQPPQAPPSVSPAAAPYIGVVLNCGFLGERGGAFPYEMMLVSDGTVLRTGGHRSFSTTNPGSEYSTTDTWYESTSGIHISSEGGVFFIGNDGLSQITDQTPTPAGFTWNACSIQGT